MRTRTKSLTVGDVSRLLGVPGWAVRRTLDELPADRVERIGRWRIIDADTLGDLAVALQARGYMRRAAEPTSLTASA